jgi:hypothetical protein
VNAFILFLFFESRKLLSGNPIQHRVPSCVRIVIGYGTSREESCSWLFCYYSLGVLRAALLGIVIWADLSRVVSNQIEPLLLYEQGGPDRMDS